MQQTITIKEAFKLIKNHLPHVNEVILEKIVNILIPHNTYKVLDKYDENLYDEGN